MAKVAAARSYATRVTRPRKPQTHLQQRLEQLIAAVVPHVGNPGAEAVPPPSSAHKAAQAHRRRRGLERGIDTSRERCWGAELDKITVGESAALIQGPIRQLSPWHRLRAWPSARRMIGDYDSLESQCLTQPHGQLELGPGAQVVVGALEVTQTGDVERKRAWQFLQAC